MLRIAPVLAALLVSSLACSGDSSAPASAPAAAPAAPAAAPAAPAVPAASTAYAGRFAADPKLTPADAAVIPPAQLRLVRNEIYARHGRSFESPDLAAHFASQPWYRPDPAYSDARLTANDKANVELLKSFEEGGVDPLVTSSFFGDTRLDFVDKAKVQVATGEEFYEGRSTTRRWTRRGAWVITWDGPAEFDAANPSVQHAQVWRLDGEMGTVTPGGDVRVGSL